MDKPAQPTYPIHELIKQRWSPRAFSDRMVEPEKLLSLLEAIRWAPSCNNEQPWNFIIATKNEHQEFERLAGCLFEKNREWAQNVPILMMSVARKAFVKNGKENYHARHDVGLAVGGMLLQATDLGLSVHQMGGFDRPKAQETYQIPEANEPVAMIAIGYMGNIDDLPEDLKEREKAPKVRKPLNEFIFSGNWNQPSSILP